MPRYASTCEPNHLRCQVPYKPNNVDVRVSTAAFVTPESPGEVPDRLDISWSRPSLDAATQLFETSNGGTNSVNNSIAEHKRENQHERAHNNGADTQATTGFLRVNRKVQIIIAPRSRRNARRVCRTLGGTAVWSDLSAAGSGPRVP